MSKRLFMEFTDENGDAVIIDVQAIDSIKPVNIKGRKPTYSALGIGQGEQIVEGLPKEILQKIVQASSDNFYLEKYGFVPGFESKGGG